MFGSALSSGAQRSSALKRSVPQLSSGAFLSSQAERSSALKRSVPQLSSGAFLSSQAQRSSALKRSVPQLYLLRNEMMIMWIIFAFASALFAGVMSILAKIGIKNTDSNLATAIRTVVVVIFAWLMVFIVGSHNQIRSVDPRSVVFLVLSGLATGASWLCYFRALQIGDINKVVPIDKSSTVLTMLLAFVFLGEGFTFLTIAAMIMIGVGTYMMIERKEVTSTSTKGYQWLVFAILAAVFASLTAILGRVGIQGVEANLGVAIRTVVVLAMAWLVVFMQGKQHEIKQIDKRSWVFIILSGLATGFSWLLFYRALQMGPASVVVPIDKLSIIVTIAFGYFVFHEKLNKKSFLGLIAIVIGTMSLLI